MNGVGRTPASPHLGYMIPAGQLAEASAFGCSNPVNIQLAEQCVYLCERVWAFQQWPRGSLMPFQVPPLQSGWACDSCDQPRMAERCRVAPQAGHETPGSGPARKKSDPPGPPCCEGAQVSRGGHAQVLLSTDLQGTPARGRGAVRMLPDDSGPQTLSCLHPSSVPRQGAQRKAIPTAPF